MLPFVNFVKPCLNCWALCLAVVFCNGLATLQAADSRPNFIVIMADDMGYNDLGCFGNSHIKTPQLDKMAREGMKCTDFHVSGNVCSPTRAGLVTGRYQQRAGIDGKILADRKKVVHKDGIQDCEVTFAELFAEAGYRTAIFGKWHLGYYAPHNPTKHGFEEFHGFVSGHVDYFTHVDVDGHLDWWHNSEMKNEEGYSTHLITKYTIDFIKAGQKSEKPFCIYLPYETSHSPHQGPTSGPVRQVGEKFGNPPGITKAELKQRYKEMIESMDEGIGKILTTLREQGIAQNTLVVFFTDNGATKHGSNAPLQGFKGDMYEGGHRVPFIAWWPETIKGGQVSDELLISLDVMPTILAAADIPVPADLKLDGVNVLPFLTENVPTAKRPLFWAREGSRAMRDGPWKLLKQHTKKAFHKEYRLFNLDEDISEKNNLASKHPERVQEMAKSIDLWFSDVTNGATKQQSQKHSGRN